jgi:ribosome biogenesis GTPase A
MVFSRRLIIRESCYSQAALVGAPNAGKSSLVNALAGRKVGAVSHKSNTTVTSRLATFELGPTQVAHSPFAKNVKASRLW